MHQFVEISSEIKLRFPAPPRRRSISNLQGEEKDLPLRKIGSAPLPLSPLGFSRPRDGEEKQSVWEYQNETNQKMRLRRGGLPLRRVFIVGWWWRPRGRRSRVQRRGSLDPRRHVGPTSRADSTAVGAGGTRGGLWTACTEFSFFFSFSFLLLPSRLAGLAG